MLKAWTTPVFDGEILVQWSQFLIFFSISISHMGGIPYCGWWNSPSKYWWNFTQFRDVFFKHFINFIQHFPAEIHQKHRFIMIYLFCSSLEKKQFRSSHVCYLNPWLSSDFCGLNSQWHPLSGAEISQNPIPLKSMISPNPNIFGA